MSVYKAKKHSRVVKFMTGYYIGQCGYKVFLPNTDNGVFGVASKEDDLILTLLDDKTIKKTDGSGKDLGFVSQDEYDKAKDEFFDILSMASQDE